MRRGRKERESIRFRARPKQKREGEGNISAKKTKKSSKGVPIISRRLGGRQGSIFLVASNPGKKTYSSYGEGKKTAWTLEESRSLSLLQRARLPGRKEGKPSYLIRRKDEKKGGKLAADRY